MTREKMIEANKAGLNGNFYNYYSPVLSIAHSFGHNGKNIADLPVVTGYRYGKAPESFVSQNYAENKSENGLSLAALNGEKEIGSSMWFSDRKVYEYTGILVDKGSDGEPIILAFDAEDLD